MYLPLIAVSNSQLSSVEPGPGTAFGVAKGDNFRWGKRRGLEICLAADQ